MITTMKSGRRRWVIGVFLLCICYGAADTCNTKDMKDHVTIAAMLGIHEDSTNCSEVSLRGIQELATLEKIVSYLNVNDAMKEGIKIGFIGPEDTTLLKSVQQISATFDKVHVIPFTPELVDDVKQATVLSVGLSRVRPRCKIILAMLSHLEWKSVIIVRDEMDSSVWLTDYIVTFAKDYLCVPNILKIPKYRHSIKTFYHSMIAEFRTTNADGIVIIVEDTKNLMPLSQVIKEMPSSSDLKIDISIIIYVSKIGLQPWNVPNNVFLLQEVSSNKKVEDLEQFYNVTLFDDYQKQLVSDYRMVNCASAKYGGTKWEEECLASNVNIPSTAFSELIDSNAVPLEYGIRLFWSALKSAHRSKCKFDSFGGVERGVCNNLLNMSPLEWKIFLQKSTFTKHEISKKISFQSSIQAHVNIYINDISAGLILIGRLSDNDTIKIEPSVIMPPVRKPSTQSGCIVAPTTTITNVVKFVPIETTTTSVTTTVWSFFDSPFWDLFTSDFTQSGKNWKDHIPMLLVCFVVFFIIFICSMKCLYRMFRVNSRSESSM